MEFSSTCESDDVSVVEVVLGTVASVEGVDRTDLSPPLHEVVDPDALDRLFRNAECPLTVSFAYRGWTVEVRGGTEIEVGIGADDE